MKCRTVAGALLSVCWENSDSYLLEGAMAPDFRENVRTFHIFLPTAARRLACVRSELVRSEGEPLGKTGSIEDVSGSVDISARVRGR